MELKDFISMREPWEYNFEFECAKIRENFTPNEKNFERFFTYKAMNGKPTASIYYPEAEIFISQVKADGYSGFDCDRCLLSIHICMALWKDWLRENKGYETDTMNSVIIPWGKLMVGDIFLKGEQKAVLNGDNTSSIRYLLECFFGEKQKAFRNALGKYNVENYINAYHTIGNFVLVPGSVDPRKGFNHERAFSLKIEDRKIEDFWDRSLKYLQEKDCNTYKNGQFNQYINCFFLWDYVEIIDNSYEIIKMTEFEEETVKKNLPDFFEKIPKIIKRRGMFMTAMLIIQDKKPDLYKKIQGYFSDKSDKNEVFLNGVNDAAEKILDKEKEFEKEIPIAAREILVELKEQGEFKYE